MTVTLVKVKPVTEPLPTNQSINRNDIRFVSLNKLVEMLTPIENVPDVTDIKAVSGFCYEIFMTRHVSSLELTRHSQVQDNSFGN